MGIAYHIWYRQGNVDKDPTSYARKIKQMIILKSQRNENMGGGMPHQGQQAYMQSGGVSNYQGNQLTGEEEHAHYIVWDARKFYEYLKM